MKKLLSIILSVLMLTTIGVVNVVAEADENVAQLVLGSGDPQGFSSLKAAFETALTQNDDYDFLSRNITLLKDVTVEEIINVSGVSDTQWQYSKPNITLNMNGHNISTGTNNDLFYLESAKLSIYGPGTINLNSNYPNKYSGIRVNGSTNQSSGTYSTLDIDNGVTIKGNDTYGISIINNNGCGYGAYIKVGESGATSIETNYGVTVNGQIQQKNGQIPNFYVGQYGTIKGGVYAAGYADYRIHGTLEGDESGIAIKAGKLTVYKEATIRCTGQDTTPTTEHSSGVNASGAAIQIESNSGYAGDIEISIEDGATITSDKSVAIYEYVASGTTNTSVKEISITGGKFLSHKDDCTDFMVSDKFDKTGFISGGHFSKKPDASYIVEEKIAVDDTAEMKAAGYLYKVVEKKIAKIEDKTYPSLEAAIADVPTNGTETTITMIDNETFADNANMTISAGKNIVLDLNGKKVTGKNLNVSTWAFLENNGTLTITDTSNEKSGKITSSTTPETDGFAGHYTVLNKNKLTLENGIIEETSKNVGNGINLKWALRNEASANQTVSLTINGGQVIGEYNAVSNYVYNDSSTCNFTVNGGTIKTTGRFSPVTMQIASGTKPNCNINISDGEFIVGNIRNTNAVGNAIIYCDDQGKAVTDTSNIKIKISGGKFNTFNTAMIVEFDGFKQETIKSSKYMSSGIMKIAINDNEIVPGYTCVANDDESTNKLYLCKIGKLTSGKIEITETENDVPNFYNEVEELQDAIDNITEANQEKENNNQEVSVSTITVNNDNGITAEIDDSIVIIAKPNVGNSVTGVLGCGAIKDVLNKGQPNEQIKYTGVVLNPGEYVVNNVLKNDGDGKTGYEKINNEASNKSGTTVSPAVMSSASSVQDVDGIGKDILENIVKAIVKDKSAMRALKLNQATAAKAINNADKDIKGNDISKTVTTAGEGTNEVAAQSISIFVKTYYDTVITEDKTSEAKKSFIFNIKPMYQAFASTATVISDMEKTGETTVAMGEPKELDNLSGKKITLKFTLPAGFVTDENQKVYVIHTLADRTKKTYDSTITKVGNDFVISFDNPDGFSVFEFTLDNPNPVVEPSSKPKSSYVVPKTGVN